MTVEQLDFKFSASVHAFQYEQGGKVVASWPRGRKVVDIVANARTSPPTESWFIEAKDFRVITSPPTPTRIASLAQTVEAKTRDTIEALPEVAKSAHHAAAAHATAAIQAAQRRVVLHLEPHPPGGSHSHLFPAALSVIVHQKLKQLVRDIDPNPLVLNIARTPAAGVPWTVA